MPTSSTRGRRVLDRIGQSKRPTAGNQGTRKTVTVEPEIRYARSGDVAIGYAVQGDGPIDLVFVHGFAGNLDFELESPYMRPFHDRMASFSCSTGAAADSQIGCGRPRRSRRAWTTSARYSTRSGLNPEVAPLGIRTMVVEPGFFRTELLTPESTTYAKPSIDDYAERTEQTIAAWNSMNGQQAGDPAKLAAALVTLAGEKAVPQRWVAGADAVATVEQKAKDILAQVDAHRDLSSNLAHDDA
jgi:hypothetical protein